jgi:hypothetical protein
MSTTKKELTTVNSQIGVIYTPEEIEQDIIKCKKGFRTASDVSEVFAEQFFKTGNRIDGINAIKAIHAAINMKRIESIYVQSLQNNVKKIC